MAIYPPMLKAYVKREWDIHDPTEHWFVAMGYAPDDFMEINQEPKEEMRAEIERAFAQHVGVPGHIITPKRIDRKYLDSQNAIISLVEIPKEKKVEGGVLYQAHTETKERDMRFRRTKSPPWRVPRWLDVDKDIRYALTKDVQDHLKKHTYGLHVKHIEVVGSYVWDARDYSDLDLNFAADDWEGQCNIMWLVMRGRTSKQIWDEWLDIQEKHQIKIDFGFRNPDSRKYVPVYDILEEKLYNEDKIQKDMHVAWDWVNNQKWQIFPRIQKRRMLSHDPYADTAPYWKEKYGDKYVEVMPPINVG